MVGNQPQGQYGGYDALLQDGGPGQQSGSAPAEQNENSSDSESAPGSENATDVESLSQFEDNLGASVIAATETLTEDDAGTNLMTSDAIWVGVGAFFTIFVIGLRLMARGGSSKSKKHKDQNSETNFFEPAGEDAEITFEDPVHDEPLADKKKTKKEKKKKKRGNFFGHSNDWKKKNRHVVDEEHLEHEPIFPSEQTDDSDYELAEDDVDQELSETNELAARTPRPKFSTLFSGKKDVDGQDTTLPSAEQHAVLEEAQRANEEAARLDHEARLERERLERERLEYERVKAEDTAKRMAVERADAERDLDQRMSALSAREREIEDQSNALREEQNSLQAGLDAALETRFSALSSALDERLNTAGANDDHPPATMMMSDTSESTLTTFADRIEDSITALNARMDAFEVDNTEAARLADEIGRLNDALAGRASLSTAGRIQLNELVHSTMTPDQFRLNVRLSNARIADCIINVAQNRAFAVNARFPVETFEQYAASQATTVNDAANCANDYRRSLLQHIVDIAEHFIIPGETMDAAIMFVPSDIIFNNLYQDFIDIVQDAARARVWIVSPTSLMAIIHTMNAYTQTGMQAAAPIPAATPTPTMALTRQPPIRDEEENRALVREIRALRKRVNSLEAPSPEAGHNEPSGAMIATQNPFRDAASEPAQPGQPDAPAEWQSSDESHLFDPAYAHSSASLSAEEEAFERIEKEEAQTEQTKSGPIGPSRYPAG